MERQGISPVEGIHTHTLPAKMADNKQNHGDKISHNMNMTFYCKQEAISNAQYNTNISRKVYSQTIITQTST